MNHRNGFKLEDDLRPIMDGAAPLPNFKQTDNLSRLVAALAGSRMDHHAGVALVDGIMRCATYFLTGTQHGRLDGGGYVLIDGGQPRNGYGGTFAICVHEVVTGAGANPRRGWHPAACSKCGLDLTVDSGD